MSLSRLQVQGGNAGVNHKQRSFGHSYFSQETRALLRNQSYLELIQVGFLLLRCTFQ